MFVRRDAIRKLLQLPYDGLHLVLKRADKHYTLDITRHPEVVSLDHLKPAYLNGDVGTDVNMSTPATSTEQPTKSPVTLTRSVGRVRQPVRFS